MDLHDFRRQYQTDGLDRSDLLDDPMAQFQNWFDAFLKLETPDPTAMVVATVSPEGKPSQRIVLLKEVSEKGFVFFTNRNSNKGKDIEANQYVSLHFPWHQVSRQVSVQGRAVPLTPEEDTAYFEKRPQKSQWAALASAQSEPLASREALIEKFKLIQKEHPYVVPRPEFWGGYRIEPERIEFWQGCEDRLHDRFVYLKEGDNWSIQRLSP